jgi:hypothetical protein
MTQLWLWQNGNQVRTKPPIGQVHGGKPANDPYVTSEDGTNHAHGLEETPYQHVTLEPGQTKRHGAARLSTVPPRSYVEGGRSHGPRPSEG